MAAEPDDDFDARRPEPALYDTLGDEGGGGWPHPQCVAPVAQTRPTTGKPPED